MAAKVHHVGISVPNLDHAVKFFADVFGVKSAKVESDEVRNLYLEFENFTLQITEDPGRLYGEKFGRLDHIAMVVDNMDETAKALKDYDVDVVWDPPVRVQHYRSNFTRRNGGVGVVFQLTDELGETHPTQKFYPEMMEQLIDPA
ncbi:VOC family protein [Croceicoccus bisphenolivorans]|uniref:VOC family protein n=1 Tax=Croceicoccus bisphenolivorans TaxID=1783232 RepID=UPI0008312123|nr:VOC family protein [Croceicoccus bisphenolivorans]